MTFYCAIGLDLFKGINKWETIQFNSLLLLVGIGMFYMKNKEA